MLRTRLGSYGQLALLGVAVVIVTACNAGTAGSGISPADVPTSSFSACQVPDGQPTWVHVILHGGKPPFHGVWTIDGKIDTTDPQRRMILPGGDTKLEILVTLHGKDDEFELQEYNNHGLVGMETWNNGLAPGNAMCDTNGNTPGLPPLQ